MAKTVFNEAARARLLQRIAALRPDSTRAWGRMTPNEMLCHLYDVVRTATGEQPARSVRSKLSHPVLRWLIIYGPLRWPRGKVKTVPEMQVTQPSNFEQDRQRLMSVIEQSGKRGPTATWAEHPAFGKLSGRDHGALLHRHIDYHLKQFGV